MGTERTYVFGGDGGGSKLDVTAMLPGLCGYRGVDPNVLAMMNGNGGFGGQNGIWGVIYLAIVASIFGWNRGGGLFGGGNCGNGTPELVTSLLNRNETAIGQLAQSLNCSTQQIQSALSSIESNVGLTGTQIINAIQSGDNGIIKQICDCCCQTQNAITKMGYENQLAVCNQTNTLVNTANANTLSLRDGATANTNAILAKLDAMQNQALQDKIAQLTAEKTALQGEISQRNQNATILNSVGQQIAPLVAGLQALQGDVDGIKCKLPNTVSVPYPQLQVYNPEVARAAAFGAAAGNYAGYGGCGCGYGYNAGFWG
mgnify:FL=1